MKVQPYVSMTLIALVGLFFLVGAAHEAGLFSERVAGWVQAIGSILAIIAGFGAARDQARSAHAENLTLAATADRNARNAAMSLAALALAEAEKVLVRLQDRRPIDGAEVQRLKRLIEYQRETIAAFPLASLKDERLMRCFAPLAGALDSVADNLREVADTTLGGKYGSPQVIALVVGRLGPLRDEVERNLGQLKHLAATMP